MYSGIKYLASYRAKATGKLYQDRSWMDGPIEEWTVGRASAEHTYLH